jgi:RNA polymerase sigma factor (sigma-70 family)
LAERTEEQDWRQFLSDYWGAVCRFSSRWGRLGLADAEDVASTTFVVLIEKKLLERWMAAPQSKFRTLLCGVVRNVIANRARLHAGRKRILVENRDLLAKMGVVECETDGQTAQREEDVFYGAWAEQFLQKCLETVHAQYLCTGRGDYYRVLYGRICDELGNAEIARALGLKTTDVENYYRRCRDSVHEEIRLALVEHVNRYCDPSEAKEEFSREWKRLGSFLQTCGGFERAVRTSYEASDELMTREHTSKIAILEALRHARTAES